MFNINKKKNEESKTAAERCAEYVASAKKAAETLDERTKRLMESIKIR